MGSGRRLTVEATGFPGTNQTWRFIQEAWREPLEALARLMGSGAVIITGCNIVSGVSSPGYIAYGGVIYYFEGGAVPESQSVVINTIVEEVEYDVDIDEDGQRDFLSGYETKTMKFGEGISIGSLNNFKRLKTISELSEFSLPENIVVDPNYVHTDNNLTDELLQHLVNIEEGAERNVQSDWNVANQYSPAYIKNKPAMLKILRKGVSYLGEFPNGDDENRLITFPSVGTTNYDVIGWMQIATSNWNSSNDVMWMIKNRTQTSFELIGRKLSGTPIVNFHYILIEK